MRLLARFLIVLAFTLGFVAVTSCTKKTPDRRAVIENYAEIVYLNYKDTLEDAKVVQKAVKRFVEKPSAPRLEWAKRAWLNARRSYGQTEAFRFYGGPIDAPDSGPEARINGWPLDESYIDYVDGSSEAGIINNPDISLAKENLAELNEGQQGDILHRGKAFDREKAISTGWHAIEFLLWGQDQNAGGPGDRPWRDYLTGDNAAHPNGDRRGRYLLHVTDLLVSDLEQVTNAWAPDEDNYRKQFVALDEKEALRKILKGIGVLAKGELGSERIDVALDTLDQEDEHSCFSDNTHTDIWANAQGIRNVYEGQYKLHRGPSLSDLVRAQNAELDGRIRDQQIKTIRMSASLPKPFDQAVTNRGSAGWEAANELVQELYRLGDQTVKAGEALGLGAISVKLPE